MTRTETLAYLGLGSNLGEREENVKNAVAALNSSPNIHVQRVSCLYETEPVGYAEQGWFINAVAETRTTLTALELLKTAKSIEVQLGRKTGPRWGPRSIDIDILLYDEVQLSSEELTIPHPRLGERLFVLLPLQELRPDWQSEDGRNLLELIEALKGSAAVRRVRTIQEGVNAV
ncbi:MAG: 2-amino-4-hydroxy-6-hydroxymethyldihydropteridine diphosphokinase [Chloroflexi bacterium]|nr:2-amino-4-hydroxy-6-hydroxymethyldihydropteridine diphosphokinase [Chloroflexota bacterium]